MKLIFAEYLKSLRERGELDIIMPDLLSEVGMNVLSRPGIGTKQYGVDVAAIGVDDGVRSMFLLSIKPGDLKRSDWNSVPQSLRPSLDQIRDVYIPTHIPSRYSDYPVVVVICIGGDVAESVWLDVKGYMTANRTDKVRFDLWNGDKLANLLLSGVLRENALPATWQSDFRKCLALVDEPRISFEHFCRLLTSVTDRCKPSHRARLTAVRQIYIALWTLYVWSRRDKNIEAAFLCSERAALIAWELVKSHLKGKSKAVHGLNATMERIISLHQVISSDYMSSYLVPKASVRHGLASAVPSRESLDVNLRLFDIVGRIGMHGLWQLHAFGRLEKKSLINEREAVREALSGTADLLMNVIQHNAILCTPVKDSQAIDIDIACLFLTRVKCDDFVRQWVENIAGGTVFAFNTHGPYPCIFEDYRDLIDHPKHVDDYRIEATAGSILLPTLAAWAAFTGDASTLSFLAEFASNAYSHSTLQLLFPGPDTEDRLYEGRARHGLVLHDFKIPDACGDMVSLIQDECRASSEHWSLSARTHGLWPLVVLASRHHRMPVPPHFWPVG